MTPHAQAGLWTNNLKVVQITWILIKRVKSTFKGFLDHEPSHDRF